MIMAPVGPLTLFHDGFRPTSRCCRLQALCRSASSNCSSQTASAHATMGSTLHVCVGSHSCIARRQVRERPACLPGKHLPTVVLKAFSLVGGMPMHLTPCRPLGMSPRLGDLTRNRTVFLVDLDLGHPLPDFGQNRILRPAPPHGSSSKSVDAQDASVRDDPPHAERLRRRIQCSPTRTADLPSTPSSSFDTRKSNPFPASQPTSSAPP